MQYNTIIMHNMKYNKTTITHNMQYNTTIIISSSIAAKQPPHRHCQELIDVDADVQVRESRQDRLHVAAEKLL
jgi:hypothetical protein